MDYYITYHDMTGYGEAKKAYLYIGKPPKLFGGKPYEPINPKVVIKLLFVYANKGYKWEFKE